MDAVVVGSGPNGLAAAVTLAQKGLKVIVFESAETMGGGTRTAELTLPGFFHDVCSAVHPLAIDSLFLRGLPLHAHGLEWIFPPLALAHPLEKKAAAVLEASILHSAQRLGGDSLAYQRLMHPLVSDWDRLSPDILAPLHFPRHPLVLARFGLSAIRSAKRLALDLFSGPQAQALFAGLAAHAALSLERPASAAFGLVLGILAHRRGWPVPRGGSRQIASALASLLRGWEVPIMTGHPIQSLHELPPARTILLDLTPRQIVHLFAAHLPQGYCRRLRRFRYGPGVFKIDWALERPIPFDDPQCLRAATVHLGGGFDEIVAAEEQVARSQIPERPFVILTQPSLFDSSRAPPQKHTAWAYCHVPPHCAVDMRERMYRQIERFAPGFRQVILAEHTMNAPDFERYNPNYVGGDINGGLQDWRQLFTRPVLARSPYRTPVPGLYLCSSSTPPGGGVHGLCGYHAARQALRDIFGLG
jgi:phytoene dehydrogenase-like protein